MKTDKNNVNYWIEKIFYFFYFMRYGILLNPFSGKIHYLSYLPKCKCKKLQIMRHGKTIGVENKEFMSDTSANSKLSDSGKNEIRSISHLIKKDLPNVVVVSKISRTMETYMELQKHIDDNLSTKFFENIQGINNTVWAGKTFEMLDEKNLLIFLKRECEHNVLLKTENGDSWADVIFRCTKILQIINKNYCNQKVLLISQGSIYQGLKILLHIEKSPWENYSASKMFNISKDSGGEAIKYGCIYDLFSE